LSGGYGFALPRLISRPLGGGGMRAGFGLEVFAAEFRARKPGASPIKNAIFQKKRA